MYELKVLFRSEDILVKNHCLDNLNYIKSKFLLVTYSNKHIIIKKIYYEIHFVRLYNSKLVFT